MYLIVLDMYLPYYNSNFYFPSFSKQINLKFDNFDNLSFYGSDGRAVASYLVDPGSNPAISGSIFWDQFLSVTHIWWLCPECYILVSKSKQRDVVNSFYKGWLKGKEEFDAYKTHEFQPQ